MRPTFPSSSGRGSVESLTFSRLVSVPENRFAEAAVRRIACLGTRRKSNLNNPLYLHGAPGSGKTHLVWALVHEVTQSCQDLVVRVVATGDLGGTSEPFPLEVWDCDLLIIEDLQRLPARLNHSLVQLFDHLHSRQQQMVFTATSGAAGLDEVSNRLRSRLGSGLVVRLEPLSAASRLEILMDRASRRQFAVSRPVLAWLAEHLLGGRQLDGALNRLESLARSRREPLDVHTVADHFREEAAVSRPTIDRIAQRVGGYFGVDARQLQSRRRQRQVMLPRQLGMYLARQLTGKSLAEIGNYFGGRDHSTVLHACRKVEQLAADDTALSGVIRQLHADLG